MQPAAYAGLLGNASLLNAMVGEIDDMNPQLFGVVMDRLYGAGALEVFYVPVQMKKNRPGALLRVILHPQFSKRGVLRLRHRARRRGPIPDAGADALAPDARREDGDHGRGRYRPCYQP